MESILSLKTSRQLKKTLYLLITGWTFVILLAVVIQIIAEYSSIIDLAHYQAKSSFEKDLVYRSWSAIHGGTYVPVTEDTQPNPYLANIENRDIQTPSGEELTLVNPAYMTRQVHELGKKQYGNIGHITSLNPIRPENLADDWEQMTLRKFEQGLNEFGELTQVGDNDYYRYMSVLKTEESCLKCHAQQGFILGDIRGGISVSVPMEEFWAIMFKRIMMYSFGYLSMWVVGIAGIVFSTRLLSRRLHERLEAEKKLIDSERKYRLLVENTDTGFVAVDENGIIIEANDPFARMIGFGRSEDVVGGPVLEWAAPECEVEITDAIALCVSQGFIKDFETIFQRTDGKRINILISATMHEMPDGKCFNAFCRDITGRKRAEEELRESNQLKELLLDIIAHDIKNPVSAMNTMVDMLVEGHSNEEIISVIGDSSKKLLHVMDTVSMLAHVTLGDRIALEEMNLTEVLKQVGNEFTQQLTKTGLSFENNLPDKLVITASPIISEVFSNYIGNAIKYAAGGKRIIVDSIEHENRLIVNVKDFGESIAREEYENIFTRKYQKKKGNGRGLGLAIVKRIAVAHQAEVGVKPNKPTGNIFYIEFPME